VTDHVLQISAGTGPVEVRRFVAALTRALADRVAARGVPIVATTTRGESTAPRSVGLVLRHDAPPVADLLGTHELVATLRGRGARRRWYAGVSLHRLPAAEVAVDPADLVIRTCRSGGPGGQHVQTTDSAVQVVHLPTGISVRADGERSQHANREAALDRLRAMLTLLADEARSDARRAAWRAHHRLVRGDAVGSWEQASRGEGLRERPA
jgi:protein subunit release factor B